MNQTLFDDQAKRRPDAKQGEKIVYEDDPDHSTAGPADDVDGNMAVSEDDFSFVEAGRWARTPKAEVHTGTEQIHDSAFEEMWNALTGTRKRYYDLLRKVWTKGYETKGGTVIHTLTDREAAAFLGVERTTINGRRNELQGGSGGDAFEAHPLVEKGNGGDRRGCHLRPDGPRVYCFKPRLDVYSVDETYR